MRQNRSVVLTKCFLWIATIAVFATAAFPYYSRYIVSALDNPPTAVITQPNAVIENQTESPAVENKHESAAAESESQNHKTVVIAVEGMTCEGCATQLNIALKRVKGVISSEASFADKNVKVDYNPKQVTIERVKKAIDDAGYVAK